MGRSGTSPRPLGAKGRYKKCSAHSMAVAPVPLWAVCVLRVALATVYFQEEFLDGGEKAMSVVVGK